MNTAPSITIQDEVLDFLMTSPTPEQIVAFHASDAAQERLRFLLDASRNESISDVEQAELEEASNINHFFALLKARAHKKLRTDDAHS